MPRLIRHVGWVLLLAACSVSARAQQGGWAEPLFEKLDHDFGIVARGAETKYRLKLTNKYPDAVHILSANTLCTCASARPQQHTIAPGETAYIEVSLDTKKYKGQRDTTLVVDFDRPQFASVRIPIKAYIRTDVVLTPGAAEFGSVGRGKSAERRINIAYAGRPNWNIKEVINKNKNLDVQLKETGRQGPTASYDLVVTLKDSTPRGELRDQVTLVTDDPANPFIPVLVDAKIETDYTINTELVDFGTLPPGGRRTINVVVRGKQPFMIEKIESEKTANVFEVRLPRDPRETHVLPLTVIAPTDSGILREEFTVTIAGSSEPLVFKAQCNVVPNTAAR